MEGTRRSPPMAAEPGLEAPGRIAIADLLDLTSSLDRAAFLARHADPFLIQLTDGAETHRLWQTTALKVHEDSEPHPNDPLPLYAHLVAKRPGANAFSSMITVGRAINNDVVLPYDQI